MEGIKLSELSSKLPGNHLELTLGEHVISLEVDTSRATPELSTKIASMVTDDFLGAIELSFSIIKSWNLMDENGEEYPRTRDAISRLPMSLIVAIQDKLTEAYYPNFRT